MKKTTTENTEGESTIRDFCRPPNDSESIAAESFANTTVCEKANLEIIGLSHVGMYAKNPASLAKFYRDVMGMQIVDGSDASHPLGASAVVGIALAQLPSPVVMGIPIRAVGVAPAVVMAAGVATTLGDGVATIMGVTTVAAEGITPRGSVRAVISPGMQLESTIPNTNLPGLVLFLGTGFRSLTLIYSRPPQAIVNWGIA